MLNGVVWNGYQVRSGVFVVHTSIHTDTYVGCACAYVVGMPAGWDGLAYSY